MDKIKELLAKYKDIILYIFFGVLTTLVNYCSFIILTTLGLFGPKFDTIINTVISWLLSVVFAYVTNRRWVFNSKASGMNAILLEMWSFLACRISTGLLDVVIMYLCVEMYGMDERIIKLASNVLVIILNYVGSKLIVFRDKSKNGGKSGEK